VSSRLLILVSSISNLIRYQVRSTHLILSHCCNSYVPSLALTSEELSFLLTPFDVKRLKSYAQNSLDYHVIVDLLPTVALLYFEKRLGNEVRLSVIQSSILLGMGLQRKSVEEVEVRGSPDISCSPELIRSSAHACRRSFSCPFLRRLRYS
jgi:tRNA(Met) C34 N-acetyltransferase TmcA